MLLKNRWIKVSASKHQHNLNTFTTYTDNLDPEILGISRSRIFDALKAEGLSNISKGYVNVHLLPIFQKKIAYGSTGFPWVMNSEISNVSYEKGICPVAEKLQDETYLSFGLGGIDLSKKDVKKISAVFRKVWANLDQLK